VLFSNVKVIDTFEEAAQAPDSDARQSLAKRPMRRSGSLPALEAFSASTIRN
jgi:hypothetical protein